jgi:hypothetical protein
MTMGEVYRKAGGKAVGAYQFKGQTFLNAMRGAGYTESDTFSPANQDRMAVWLIENARGVSMQLIKNNPDEAMKRLAMEWAGLPLPNGRSYYAGVGDNAANVSPDQVRGAFERLGAAREEERVRQVNPQSVGMQGPTAPDAVGTGSGTSGYGGAQSSISPSSTPMSSSSIASAPTNIATVPSAMTDDMQGQNGIAVAIGPSSKGSSASSGIALISSGEPQISIMDQLKNIHMTILAT